MNVLIIDDEELARATLITLITVCSSEISSIREADSVKTALAAIQSQKPDLIFLDISLNDGNGFDILRQSTIKNLNIIFVTAHNEYGVKALKASAIDYLIKPINSSELTTAILKAKEKIATQRIHKNFELLLSNLDSPKTEISKIVVKTMSDIHLIQVEDIIYCESDKGYTTFYLVNQRKVVSSKSLGEYEDILPENHFMRTHHSFLVNLNHVIRYEKRDKNVLVMVENHAIAVSVRRREALIHYFDQLK
ncbi:LytR/AlgR family response regulator transcription factor [Aureispira anguillae]|uniref:LytTR family DNA-binding domain-containing protein n=1 Tax=Aureispira anguillae TaxID=2864201 RepID=A0A915YLI9_9BACT|nr:LytTR family DNA-binding domain-containing protein [Aureispira anguillae]BDS15229.1 LytTR family DNA-binding domain-containing protein [Aureispira anguillae]